MLRHVKSGQLYIYTDILAMNTDLEVVDVDPQNPPPPPAPPTQPPAPRALDVLENLLASATSKSETVTQITSSHELRALLSNRDVYVAGCASIAELQDRLIREIA